MKGFPFKQSSQDRRKKGLNAFIGIERHLLFVMITKIVSKRVRWTSFYSELDRKNACDGSSVIA